MTLKVIGAGFGRTGTASLKIALEKLLGAPCYHMSEVIGNAGHIDLWIDAAAGKPDWNAIFGDYVATVDFPASNYTMQLAKAYPDAKVLLSHRDPERWFESTQDTIFSKRLQGFHAGTKWGRMLKATIDDHIGGDENDRDAVIAAFNDHNAAVREAFGPDRLTVYEPGDGWGPLCEMLGLPEPDEPLPHVNSREEFAGVFELLASPIGPAAMNGDGIGGANAHGEMFEKP